MNREKLAGQVLAMEELELVAGGDDREFMKALLNRKTPADWTGVERLYNAAGITITQTTNSFTGLITRHFKKGNKTISHLDARIIMARYVGKPSFDVTKY